MRGTQMLPSCSRLGTSLKQWTSGRNITPARVKASPVSSYVQEVLTDKNPLNTTLVAPETIEQAEEANVLRKEVAEILTGVR